MEAKRGLGAFKDRFPGPFFFWLALAVIFLVCCFLVPLFAILVDSFRSENVWSFDNYRKILSQNIFLTAFFRTLKISAIVTAVSMVIAYPAAISIYKMKRKTIIMPLLIIPLMVNPVARTYTWLTVLGRQGLINSFLLHFQLISTPLRLIYTEPAVVLGLLQLFLPFMILALVSALENLPGDVQEAALSLGARPLRAFLTVTLPLTREGMVFGATIVFTGCTTAYVTPAMLGGTRVLVLSTLLYQRAMYLLRWSEATVIAMVMLATVLLVHQLLKVRRF